MYLCGGVCVSIYVYGWVCIYIYIKESLGAPTEQVMSEENMVR